MRACEVLGVSEWSGEERGRCCDCRFRSLPIYKPAPGSVRVVILVVCGNCRHCPRFHRTRVSKTSTMRYSSLALTLSAALDAELVPLTVSKDSWYIHKKHYMPSTRQGKGATRPSARGVCSVDCALIAPPERGGSPGTCRRRACLLLCRSPPLAISPTSLSLRSLVVPAPCLFPPNKDVRQDSL